MAIPPEVFPVLSAVVRTRVEWEDIHCTQSSGKAFKIVVPHADFQEDEERIAASSPLDGKVTLRSRQDQLIEATSALSRSVQIPRMTPAVMQASPIWQQQGARMFFGFNALVLVAAVVVSVLSYRNLNATRDVVALMDRVNEVGSIEMRIAAKLDLSNVGVQNLINETNSRIAFLQAQVSALPADTKGIIKELGDIANDMQKIPGQLATVRQSQLAEQAEVPDAYNAPRPKRISVRNPTLASADIASIPAPKPLPAASKAFRRIVAEDGSVKFEKIR